MPARITLLLSVCLLAGAVPLVAAATRQAPSSPPPSAFRPAADWVTVKHSRSEPDVSPFMVWAITTPDAPALEPIQIFTSLTHLHPDGIAIWAATIFPHNSGTHSFPTTTLPLHLSQFRTEDSWEMQPKGNIQQRLRWVVIDGWTLDIRVFFATQHPGRRLLRTAQTELNRLVLPKTH